MESYLEHTLKAAVAEKKKPAVPAPSPFEVVKEWWNNQPDEIKKRKHLTMDFFMRDFDTSPGYMGKLLYQLGFKKDRLCPNDGPHQRVWIPPR